MRAPTPRRPWTAPANRLVEKMANRVVRAADEALRRARLGGRKAQYDDARYEFVGGPADELRKKHYDKSLRLLWKGEAKAPWASFRDMSDDERTLEEMARKGMSPAERRAHEKITRPEFVRFLDETYSLEEKKAIVAVLTGIGHGEAYAWLTSAELLADVKSTGARAALTMQVLEEAKHFVVLRELIRAFRVPVPRQSAWEYALMEGVLKAEGLEKLFGMNIVIEGIALSFFQLMSELPGLEILRLFHLDESRHAALPVNYFGTFPLSDKKMNTRLSRAKRLKMILPAILLIPHIEEELAVLGVDAFEFGGAVIRRIATMAERAGFKFPVSNEVLLAMLDAAFNAYCVVCREGHALVKFTDAEPAHPRAGRPGAISPVEIAAPP